jgi:hypothetical protein
VAVAALGPVALPASGHSTSSRELEAAKVPVVTFKLALASFVSASLSEQYIARFLSRPTWPGAHCRLTVPLTIEQTHYSVRPSAWVQDLSRTGRFGASMLSALDSLIFSDRGPLPVAVNVHWQLSVVASLSLPAWVPNTACCRRCQ